MSEGAPPPADTGPVSGTTLAPQPHGGALLVGGKIGNKGGHGRTPAAFRRLARKLIADRKLMHRLADMAEGKIGEIIRTRDGVEFCETPLREQRGAADVLMRIAFPQAKEVSTDDVRDKLAATIGIIREQLPPDDAERILGLMREVWGR